jgi:hypothetical protein
MFFNVPGQGSGFIDGVGEGFAVANHHEVKN